ncbi:MAG: hypothetical protein ACWA41_02500 [Putridiphycobacter sp.]
MSLSNLSAKNFFQIWREVVFKRKNEFLLNWRNPSKITELVIGSDNSIVALVARELGLKVYQNDYYAIDSIFYHDTDLVEGKRPIWFRDIKIAFEHENYCQNLFQEVSHLLITNSALKVLVAYPNNEKKKLEELHSIIKDTRHSIDLDLNENFLIIFGYENNFLWEGYVYKKEFWLKIN